MPRMKQERWPEVSVHGPEPAPDGGAAGMGRAGFAEREAWVGRDEANLRLPQASGSGVVAGTCGRRSVLLLVLRSPQVGTEGQRHEPRAV